ncbi:MAG: polysaccharide deacetylase family protein, partial [Candidatus Zixiibacteriota bacterium]
DRTRVAITFDDGYDDLMLLEPLLRRFRIPILVFIPTAYIGKANDWDNFLSAGKRRHLTETQIRQLSTLGVQFGSHGHTHRDVTRMSDAELAEELTVSKRWLEDLTESAIVDIAFPFGRSNQGVIETARKLGYVRQFASAPLADNSDVVGRIAVSKIDAGISLQAKLSGNALAGIEVVKGLIISKFSHLTPVVKRG